RFLLGSVIAACPLPCRLAASFARSLGHQIHLSSQEVNCSSLLASTAFCCRRHGMPPTIGNACPSSGQNQQSARRTNGRRLIGETNSAGREGFASATSTTKSEAALTGFWSTPKGSI